MLSRRARLTLSAVGGLTIGTLAGLWLGRRFAAAPPDIPRQREVDRPTQPASKGAEFKSLQPRPRADLPTSATVFAWPETWRICLPPYVRHEGQVGNECGAHAVVTGMECWIYFHKRELADRMPLSEMDLYEMSRSHSVPQVLRAAESYGVLDHDSYSDPSRPRMSGEQRAQARRRFWIPYSRQVTASPSRLHQQMIKLLEDGHPIVTNHYIDADFQRPDPDVLPYRITRPLLHNAHAVCLVGYDRQNRHWIAKNSYGSAWGIHGCFAFPMGDSVMRAETQMYAIHSVYPPQPV